MNKMIADLLISDSFDPVEFIKNNYIPVEDKPNYVWLDRRRCQMISVDNLAASVEDWYKRLLKKYEEESKDKEWIDMLKNNG